MPSNRYWSVIRMNASAIPSEVYQNVTGSSPECRYRCPCDSWHITGTLSTGIPDMARFIRSLDVSSVIPFSPDQIVVLETARWASISLSSQPIVSESGIMPVLSIASSTPAIPCSSDTVGWNSGTSRYSLSGEKYRL